MRVSARLVVFVGLSIVVTAGSCVAAVGFAGGGKSLPWALLPTAIVAATAAALARRFLLHAGELEQALRRESAQRDRILNSVPAMVFMKDTSNRLAWVNDAYVEAMGMSRERLLSKPVGELFPRLTRTTTSTTTGRSCGPASRSEASSRPFRPKPGSVGSAPTSCRCGTSGAR
jgi:PAS domain S-box-containing protein